MKSGDKLLANLRRTASIRDLLATTPYRVTQIDVYIRVDHYDNPESIIWGDFDETVEMWRGSN